MEQSLSIIRLFELTSYYAVEGSDRSDNSLEILQKIISSIGQNCNGFEIYSLQRKIKYWPVMNELLSDRLSKIASSNFEDKNSFKKRIERAERIDQFRMECLSLFPDLDIIEIDRVQYKILKKYFDQPGSYNYLLLKNSEFSIRPLFAEMIRVWGREVAIKEITAFYRGFEEEMVRKCDFSDPIIFTQKMMIKKYVELYEVLEGDEVTKWVDETADSIILDYISQIVLLGFFTAQRRMSLTDDLNTFLLRVAKGKEKTGVVELQRDHLQFFGAALTNSRFQDASHLKGYAPFYAKVIDLFSDCLSFITIDSKNPTFLKPEYLHSIFENITDFFGDSGYVDQVISQLHFVFSLLPAIFTDYSQIVSIFDLQRDYAPLMELLDFLILHPVNLDNVQVDLKDVRSICEVLVLAKMIHSDKCMPFHRGLWQYYRCLMGPIHSCTIIRAIDIGTLACSLSYPVNSTRYCGLVLTGMLDELKGNEDYETLATDFHPFLLAVMVDLHLNPNKSPGEFLSFSSLFKIFKGLIESVSPAVVNDKKIYERISSFPDAVSKLLESIYAMNISYSEKFRLLFAVLGMGHNEGFEGWCRILTNCLMTFKDAGNSIFCFDPPVGEETDFLLLFYLTYDSAIKYSANIDIQIIRRDFNSFFCYLKHLYSLDVLKNEGVSQSFTLYVIGFLSSIKAYDLPTNDVNGSRLCLFGLVNGLISIYKSYGDQLFENPEENPVMVFFDKCIRRDEWQDALRKFLSILSGFADHKFTLKQVRESYSLFLECEQVILNPSCSVEMILMVAAYHLGKVAVDQFLLEDGLDTSEHNSMAQFVFSASAFETDEIGFELIAGYFLFDKNICMEWRKAFTRGVSLSHFLNELVGNDSQYGVTLIERYLRYISKGVLPNPFIQYLTRLLFDYRDYFGFMTEHRPQFYSLLLKLNGISGLLAIDKSIFDDFFLTVHFSSEVICEKTVRFNTQWLKEEVVRINQRKIPFDLGPQDWIDLKTGLIERIEVNPELSKFVPFAAWGNGDRVDLAENEHKLEWDEIKTGCLASKELESLFVVQGSTTLLQLKLYYALRFILEGDPKIPPEGLSEREIRLIQFSAMVLTCVTAKHNGISAYYDTLPDEAKIPTESSSLYDEQAVLRLKGKEFVWGTYQDFLKSLFANNTLLIRELCGLDESEPVYYPIHQRQHAINTIGAQVGFEDGITLDPDNGCIYEVFAKRSISGNCLAFSKYFSVDAFLSYLCRRVNLMVNEVDSRGVPIHDGLYGSLDVLLSGDEERELWVMGDDGKLALTGAGALEAVLATSILTIE